LLQFHFQLIAVVAGSAERQVHDSDLVFLPVVEDH
jgi:hypothetical protein